MKILWEQVGTRFVLYLVCMPFFGMLGFGSLNYFASISGISEGKLRSFLDNLHFPFKTLIEVYYGAPQENVVSILLNATPRSAMITRILGGIFPILFIVVSLFNLITYEHTLLEIVVALAFDTLFGMTSFVMWRFGYRLTQV